MIVVDTSVWVGARRQPRTADILHALIDADEVALALPVRMELWAGVSKHDRKAFLRAFGALPQKLRVVATLALIEDVPHAEIADALGVPIGTVKSRLFRATRELRQELQIHDR